MKTWVKELTIKNKTDVHKVNYLIHNVSGHVITSQVKAWNDTVRMCMWFEIIILPIRNKLGKMLIWCDNCGSHLTQAVKTVITDLSTEEYDSRVTGLRSSCQWTAESSHKE